MGRPKKEAKIIYSEKEDKKIFNSKAWQWVLKLEEFLQENPADLGLTDLQIFDNVNARLTRSKRISLSTWEALKGNDDGKYGINNKPKWSDEQKDYVKDMIRMARSVKSSQLMRTSIQSTNKNSIGAHRIVSAMNPHLQTNQLALGDGNVIINVLPPPKQDDEVVIDIPHVEEPQKKIE